MQIYLIRHAHAMKGEDDAARTLSPKGRKQIKGMAAFLRRGGLLQAAEFWHSPLVRSRDTATLLIKGLGVRVKQVEVSGIGPEADPAVMVRRLKKVRRPVAVVGHEPHLSGLAAHLLTEGDCHPVIIFKKCAVATLERSGKHWVLRWLVSPDEILWKTDDR